MGNAEYDVLFDLAGTPYQPPTFAIVWTTLIAAACLLSFAQARGNWRLLPAAGALGMVAFGAFSIKAHYDEFLRMRNAVEGGRAAFVEGLVREFEPDAAGGNGAETFVVADQRFIIRSNVETPAFNRTVGVGGPDLTDTCVRIHFLREGQSSEDVRIVWLGVRRSGCD